MQISAVIIAFNEEKNIAAAVESVKWADEIVVVDSDSSDRTREIAAANGARVVVQKWLGFGSQKKFAAAAAAHDWIFSLDADERVSEKLKAEILRLKTAPESGLADGYRIPRLSFYFGKPIRHGGWYPDWQMRLFNRRKGDWSEAIVHESVQMNKDSRVGKLKNDILHFTVENAAHHHRMIGERYAPLAAEKMFRGGKKTSRLKVVTAGVFAFVQTYFLKAGFLDGFAGFCIARFAAQHAFLKHLMLWEKQNISQDN